MLHHGIPRATHNKVASHLFVEDLDMKVPKGRLISLTASIALTVLYLCIICVPFLPHSAYAEPARPLVAIHVSELTAALQSVPAVSPTPTGTGNSGYEWWYTAWKYPVAYESLK